MPKIELSQEEYEKLTQQARILYSRMWFMYVNDMSIDDQYWLDMVRVSGSLLNFFRNQAGQEPIQLP